MIMTSIATSGIPSRRAYWGLWLVVAIVLCVPVWLCHIPPLSDYYNHLARLYIISHYDTVEAYQRFYTVQWSASPNLALELVGRPLMAVFSLALTAKLFLTITILLWHIGCTTLGRAVYGRLTWRALVCSFFVYNQQFLHGYCNFVFSMGLALLALSLWIESRDRWSIARVLILTLVATQVFFAHLSGFATLGIAVAAMTLSRLASQRRIDLGAVAGAIPLVPGTIVFFLGFLKQTGDSDSGTAFAPLLYNIRDSMTVLTGYDKRLDMASMAVVAALVLVVLVLHTRAGIKRDLFAAGASLFAVYWVCPADVASGLEVNVRFMMGAVTLLAFSLDISVSERLRRGILGVALALFVVRTASTAASWMELDAEHDAQLAAFEHIDKGAAVHNIYFYPAPALFNADRVRGLALIHGLTLAAVTREANVPTLYAIRGQQPLAHRIPLYRAHRFRDGSQPTVEWDAVFAAYQYVWACRPPPGLLAPLEARATPVAHAGSCTLYRL